MKNSLVILLESKKTVFTIEDLMLLWNIGDQNYLKVKLYRLIKNNQLIRLRGGIYVLNENYNRLELANKLLSPSYVSFQTILGQRGAVFQFDSRVLSAARYNRIITVGKETFVYRKIKDSILFNNNGIINENNISTADAERALVDTLYLDKNFYFDNLEPINLDKCLALAPLYQNKQLIKRITALKKSYAR